MTCAAQNHVVSGSLERCIIVPAVTEVCRPQSRHSCKRGRLFSPTARRLPQPGHTKPSGQRRLNKKDVTQPRIDIPSTRVCLTTIAEQGKIPENLIEDIDG
jgi:hypothetical protein